MTKAIVVLKSLIANRKLNTICKYYNISYKYCHRIAHDNSTPSYDLMNKLKELIPPSMWFEEADSDFIKEVVGSDKIE